MKLSLSSSSVLSSALLWSSATASMDRTLSPVVVQVGCNKVDFAQLDAVGKAFVAQALKHSYNAVHAPITHNYLGPLVFSSNSSSPDAAVSTATTTLRGAALSVERKTGQAAVVTFVEPLNKQALEGAGDVSSCCRDVLFVCVHAWCVPDRMRLTHLAVVARFVYNNSFAEAKTCKPC
jgi:hypothetical protein